MGLVARTLRIGKGEGRLALLLVALMFVAMSSITIGESGIDAIFFERIGAHALPLMYLLQGATTLVAMLALTGVLGRLGPRRAYLVTPVAMAALVASERAVLLTGVRWVYPVLWVTVALGTLVQGVFLWGTAGAVVDTRQAKRLFPIFAAGGILGSVVGGLVTRPLAPAIGAENLLVVWAGGLAVAFALCRAALGPAARGGRRRAARRRSSAIRDMAAGFAFVRRSRLLRWMTAGAVLFSILFYSLYLPYARAASERFPNADELAGFFGLFWAGVTATAFVVSILVTNRLLGRFGVATVAIVLPLLYTGAFGILLVDTTFVTLVTLRFVIGVWLQGVASPGWETLINVVPEKRRDQTRAFLNGGPTQVGTAIAGVVALVGQEALSPRQLAVIGLAAALLTVVAALGIRRSYTSALLDALRAGRPQVFDRVAVGASPVPLPVDAEAARVLSASMRSGDVRTRRLAMQLVAELPPDVRPPGVLVGLRDEDALVRLAAVHGLDPSNGPEREALPSMARDPDATVAAAASARALTAGGDEGLRDRLRALLAAPDDAVRRSVVEQLALAPAPVAAELVDPLLGDASAEVRAAAFERLADADPGRALERALAGLRDPDPAVRIAAGRALASAGPPAVEPALAALDDATTADAAIEALRRVRADGAGDRIRAFVRSAAERATADRELARAVDDEAAQLLRDAFLDRGRRTARSALWAAATLSEDGRAAMTAAIESLDADHAQVANALETLESAADPALVRPLLALWEPTQDAPKRHHVSWLDTALADDDSFIRRCAELVRARREGGAMPRSATALSEMERILFLRQVPLFADLSPIDLQRAAAIAEERAYADGEPIASQGELGDDLHIVVEGTIRVVRELDGTPKEVARRSVGEVVGEMSIISQRPRFASLVADGPVRTIRIGHREFESMLRERPSVAVAVMRVLVGRLAEAVPAQADPVP